MDQVGKRALLDEMGRSVLVLAGLAGWLDDGFELGPDWGPELEKRVSVDGKKRCYSECRDA